MLRTKSDSLMAGVDHSWEDWFAGDPGFKTNSTSPFDFAKNPPSEPSGFVHLLRHGVDIGQAMKTGPLWYRVDGAEADRTNAQAALEWADAYLHRADGMYWGDEEVQGVSSPSRGTETCSIVETMFNLFFLSVMFSFAPVYLALIGLSSRSEGRSILQLARPLAIISSILPSFLY